MTSPPQDKGSLTEDGVQAAVEDAFSADFVFRSPRRQDGKEVTDVLVLFDDVGLVIQAKAQAVRPRDALSWAAKHLGKASRQIGGAVRALRSGRVKTVANERRGRVPFDVSHHPYLYGLAVLHDESPPYSPQDVVPELATVSVPVHVLSFRDFRNLAHCLDTPGDLIDYLELRTDVLIPTLQPKVHEEQGVFSYFVDHYEDLLAFRAEKRGDDFTAADAAPSAKILRGTLDGAIDARPSLIIDKLIDRIHDIDPGLEPVQLRGQTLSMASKEEYAQIATVLGYIPRARRLLLGRRILDIANRVAQSGGVSQLLTYSPKRNDCLVYVVSSLPEDRRRERRENLAQLTQAAKAYCDVETAIGIATNPPGQGGGSQDFVLQRGENPKLDEEATEKLEELGKKLFGDLNRRLIDQEL